MSRSSALINKLLAFVLLALCTPLLYHYAIGQWHSERLIKLAGTPKDTIQTLDLNQINPQQLSSEALVRLSEHHQQQTSEQLLDALKKNPSNGLLASHLATTIDNQHLAELASQLWPSHSHVHYPLANYWLKKDHLDKTLAAWHVTLNRSSNAQFLIFPLLSKYPEFDQGLQLLKPYTDNPPTWWNAYFSYVARQAPFPAVSSLFQARIHSDAPITKEESKQYIERLIKEKHWRLAHTIWFSSLAESERQYSESIFDGGFESTLFNTAFSWQIKASKDYQAALDISRGTVGQKSLKLTFIKGKRINFQHVQQTLVLPAGDYQLSLNYKTERFSSNKGLNWRIRCVHNPQALIAESTTYKQQNSEWLTENIPFTVPDQCPAQLLRLESNSRYAHDHLFNGSVWFDDLRIETQ